MDYLRQQPLNLEVPERAVVVGCGGVGSWVALLLALSGTRVLELYDGDFVDTTNLARCPYTPRQLGENKAMALRDLILQVRPEADVRANTMMATGMAVRQLAEQGFTVFDCTDNLRIQRTIAKAAPGRIRVGYDGTEASVTNDEVPEWGDGDETPRGPYNFVPTWAAGAVFAAALGVAYAHRGGQGLVSHDLDELVNRSGRDLEQAMRLQQRVLPR